MILMYVDRFIKKAGDNMTAIRQEILSYIDEISDNKLEALKPILTLLVDDSIVIESDLSSYEKEIIMNGREEYEKGGFIPLDEL